MHQARHVTSGELLGTAMLRWFKAQGQIPSGISIPLGSCAACVEWWIGRVLRRIAKEISTSETSLATGQPVEKGAEVV